MPTPLPRTYGYARVSSKDQNLARQLDALTAFGVDPRLTFTDKSSGRDFDRPGYRGLLRRLRRGDALVIASIDRLGRNYGKILEQWRRITKERGAAVVVLDTRTPPGGGGLTGEFLSDVVLQLLSYVAQTEREFIHQRQAEGIAAARMRGKKFGRPRVSMPEELWRLKEEWAVSYTHLDVYKRQSSKSGKTHSPPSRRSFRLCSSTRPPE